MPRELEQPFLSDIPCTAVESTSVAAVGWQADVLEVHLVKGSAYQHRPVPLDVANAILHSGSPGSSYRNLVVQAHPKFDSRKIADDGNGALRQLDEIEREALNRAFAESGTPVIETTARTVAVEVGYLPPSIADKVFELEAQEADFEMAAAPQPGGDVLLNITTNEGYTYWGDQVLPQVKRLADLFEGARMETKRPLLDLGREVDNLFRPFGERFALLVDRIQSAMTRYNRWVRDQREIAAAAERKRLQEDNDRRKRAAVTELTANGHTPEQAEAKVAQLNLPAPAVTTAGPALPQSTKSKAIETWTFEIDDVNLIPREYLLPDEVAIRARVKKLKAKHGIPGIRAFVEDGFATKKK